MVPAVYVDVAHRCAISRNDWRKTIEELSADIANMQFIGLQDKITLTITTMADKRKEPMKELSDIFSVHQCLAAAFCTTSILPTSKLHSSLHYHCSMARGCLD